MQTKLGIAALSLAFLAACNGSRDEGIHAAVTAQAVGNTASQLPEAKSFRRNDGVRIDLELGLLNLAPVELLPCGSSVALQLRGVFAAFNPLSSAHAHGGAEGAAAGVIDVIEPDRTTFDLGEVAAAPGDYCGIVVELQPGQPAKHGDALDTSMTGASVNVAPCYYAGTANLSDADAAAATDHACIQAKYSGAVRTVTLRFANPVTLDAAHRHVDVSVAARYDEWFDNLDLNKLATDAAEQAKLADNVAASLYAYTGEEQDVALKFALQVNGQSANCNQVYENVGSGAQKDYQLKDFRFYLSEVHLHGATGSSTVRLATKATKTVYQDDSNGVALLGLTQGCDGTSITRNLSLSGTAKAGDFEQICFTLGVPFALNHIDAGTAPSPLNVTAMNWVWLAGRKFVKIDGVGDADGVRSNYFVHLGSTGCTNGTGTPSAPPDAACGQPNRPEICLSYAQLRNGGTIVADVAPVLAESDITVNTAGTAAGCMSSPSDPECAAILPNLGLPFNATPAREQQLFHVVN